MASLHIPNAEALRVALAAGLVPAAVARSAVVASFDAAGGIWLADADLPPAALAALVRFGVRASSTSLVGSRLYPCWPALVPLRPFVESGPPSVALIEVPLPRLATFCAGLGRSPHAGVRVLLLDDAAAVLIEHPPSHVVELARSPGEGLTLYRLWAGHVWKRDGLHLDGVAESLPDGDGLILADAGRRWRRYDGEEFHALRSVAPILRGRQCSPVQSTPPRVPVNLKLVGSPASSAPVETHGIAPGRWQDLATALGGQDEETLKALEFQEIEAADGTARVLVRGLRGGSALPAPFQPFVTVPGGLVVPQGWQLKVKPRPAALRHVLGGDANGLTWWESSSMRNAIGRAPATAFRPVTSAVRYVVPDVVAVEGIVRPADPFTLPAFVALPEPRVPLDGPTPPAAALVEPAVSGRRGSPWLQRLSGRLFASKSRPAKPEADPEADTAREIVVASANDWAARRTQLEQVIFTLPSDLSEPVRAAAWRELAEVCGAMGHWAEAGLAWSHAVWHHPAPPAGWCAAWEKVERRAAKLDPEATGRDDLLAQPASPPVARAIAVTLVAEAAVGGRPPSRGLLDAVDRSAADLSVRHLWLAHTAASDLAGGDLLQLARARDRLKGRLADATAEDTPDAPGFLRLRGAGGGGRLHVVSEWLCRARDAAQRWLKIPAGTARLPWAGLDADAPCTRAYADLIFATAAARLGDRVRGPQWQAEAEATLLKAEGPGVDPNVHRELIRRFRSRLFAADAADEAAFDDTVSRYAVAKLSNRLIALGSAADPYERKALAALPGAASLDGPFRNDAAAALPGRVFLELEDSARLKTLALLPAAIERLPADLPQFIDGERRKVIVRLVGRAVERSCGLATKHGDGPGYGSLCTTLLRLAETDALGMREVLAATAMPLFATGRALGRRDDLTALMTTFERRPAVAERLPAAVGRFALGQDDRGVRLLDDARRRLFETPHLADAERGDLALAYARVLRHAPPALALGRLTEIFQRLDRVPTGGAAGRYYALRPLEIVDAVVASAVTDEFALDADARAWLAADADRVRRRIARDLAAVLAAPAGL